VKLCFRLVILATVALVVLFAPGNMIPSVAGAAPTIRWDTISLTFPNGVPTIDAGGSDYALAADLTTIQISGSGTFSSPREESPVTGGGLPAQRAERLR
jgi:hypothetical protein